MRDTCLILHFFEMKLFSNFLLVNILGSEIKHREQRDIDHPCPSFTCWDWNEDTGECDLKPDHNCFRV